MHLAKNPKINFSRKACQNVFATTRYFLFISSHLALSKTKKRSVALQTASVAADDRLMKRVQSWPAGWFCACSKKPSVMSGWFQRAGGHANAHSVIYGHTQMGGGDLFNRT